MAASIPRTHPRPKFDPAITIDGEHTMQDLANALDGFDRYNGRVTTLEGLVDSNDVGAIGVRVGTLETKVGDVDVVALEGRVGDLENPEQG